MTESTGIEIIQVGNGFVVSQPRDIRRNYEVTWGETLVFRTLAELQHFISEHFKHRAQVELNDPKP